MLNRKRIINKIFNDVIHLKFEQMQEILYEHYFGNKTKTIAIPKQYKKTNLNERFKIIRFINKNIMNENIENIVGASVIEEFLKLIEYHKKKIYLKRITNLL